METNAQRSKGFTLLELLIVVAIVATILAIIVLVLNPVEYLKRGRDSQRLMDYTLINQAVNFYSYGAAVSAQDPDLDGPNYTNSCSGQSDQKLFVSVPADNGESAPTPPSGWIYSRVSSTPLREIDGAGWLPIDFHTIKENLRPLQILPVDPINTFADGFYYTYTCGSFELNLRFETSKYNELASTDGGDDPNVYEIGSVLTEAPYQNNYHTATDGSGGASAGTTALYPNTTGYYNTWSVVGAAAGWDAVNDASGSLNTSDYVNTSSTGNIITFGLEDPSGGQSGAITAVRVRMSLVNTNGAYTKQIIPRIRACDGLDTGNCLSYDLASSTNINGTVTNITGAWTQNPHMNRAWSWDDIKTLEAGGVSSGTYTNGQLRMYQLYVEVDHQ